MAEDKNIRFLAKEVYPYIWCKNNLIPKVPALVPSSVSGHITAELLNNLRKVIWVQTYKCWSEWRRFLRKHANRMVSSSELFAAYSLYACYVTKDTVKEPYERFISVFSLAAEFAVYASSKGHKEYIHMAPEIMTRFFEKEISHAFYDHGGWKRLNKHLLRKEHLQLHRRLKDLIIEGKSKADILEIFKFDSEDRRKPNKRPLKDIEQTEVEGHEPSKTFMEYFVSFQFPSFSASDVSIQPETKLAQQDCVGSKTISQQQTTHDSIIEIQSDVLDVSVASTSVEMAENTNLKEVLKAFSSIISNVGDAKGKKAFVLKLARLVLAEIHGDIATLEQLINLALQCLENKL